MCFVQSEQYFSGTKKYYLNQGVSIKLKTGTFGALTLQLKNSIKFNYAIHKYF